MSEQPDTDENGAATPATASRRSFLMTLLHEAGLKQSPRCFSDYRFLLALLAGIVVLWAIHDMLPPFSSSHELHWQLWISVVVWYPVLEEILFRGIVQGQLFKTAWGQRSWLQVSAANAVTSLLFVGFHMIQNPPLFAITVFVPSLLFGYFRDSCSSIYPSILLHGAFNALVIDGLLIHGNLTLPYR